MSTQSQYIDMFSEGIATGQPPAKAQIVAAIESREAEVGVMSGKIRRLQNVMRFSDAMLLLSFLPAVALLMYLIQAIAFQHHHHALIVMYSTPLMVGVLIVQILARLVVLRVIDKLLNEDLPGFQSRLDELTDLDPEQHPEACVNYAALGEEDKTIRAYQRQIAAQGRLPVLAEYTYAQAWVNKRREQEARDTEIAAAKAACQQWAKPA